MAGDYARAGPEPGLEEALRDPIVRLVMRRDGLTPPEVRRVIEATRRRLSLPDLPAGAVRRAGGPDGVSEKRKRTNPRRAASYRAR